MLGTKKGEKKNFTDARDKMETTTETKTKIPNKTFIATLVVAFVLVAVIYYSSRNKAPPAATPAANAVAMMQWREAATARINELQRTNDAIMHRLKINYEQAKKNKENFSAFSDDDGDDMQRAFVLKEDLEKNKEALVAENSHLSNEKNALVNELRAVQEEYTRAVNEFNEVAQL
jgi:hypothetical protein